MSSAQTPPPSNNPDDRARNGGTSAPSGGSVWDLGPTSPAAPHDQPPPPEPAPEPDQPEARPAPASAPTPDKARPTEPLLGSTPAPSPTPAPEPAAPKRAVPQTPNARQREKARQAIAAAAAGQPVRSGPSVKTLILVGIGVLLVLALSVIAWVVLLGGDDTEAAVPVGTLAEQVPAPTTTLELAELDVESPAIAPTITTEPTPATTAAPSTTAAPATTAAPETTAAPSTTAAPETTAAPSTTAAPTTTVAAAAVGPRIVIEPRNEPCKFGNDCLVAGFTLVEFGEQPDSFVCEFADGSRYTFPLETRSVSYACATGSRGDSITIDIDGVRSETAVHD